MSKPSATTDTPALRCFAHHHMTASEYGLWDVCRSLAHKTGVLYFNGRGIAARFKSMSKNTPYTLAESLVEGGWFKLLKESQRRRDGTYSPRQYKVVTHQEWVEEHPNQCYSPSQNEGLDQNQPVPITDCPVPITDQPAQNEGHNLIEILPTKKQPTTLPTNHKPSQNEGLDEVNGFVGRFAKRRRPKAEGIQHRREATAEPIRIAQPVPDFGMAVRDTHTEAVRLATPLVNQLNLSSPQYTQPWVEAIIRLLEQGHSRETIQAVSTFAYSKFGERTMRAEGPTGFEQHFDQIVQAMTQLAERTVTQ